MTTRRKPTTPDSWDFEPLLIIDKQIDVSEAESMHARWEFGRLMLAAREGKKRLPNGYLAALIERTGKSRRELGYRIQFAERFPTENELCNALHNCASWHEMVESFAPEGETDQRFIDRLQAERASTFTVPATIEDLRDWAERRASEDRRLQAICFKREFERIDSLPSGWQKDAAWCGTYAEFVRTAVGWGRAAGDDDDAIADVLGMSVTSMADMFEDDSA